MQLNVLMKRKYKEALSLVPLCNKFNNIQFFVEIYSIEFELPFLNIDLFYEQ